MMFRMLFVAFLLALPLAAQQRVNPRNSYERVLCIVPLIGAGTPTDPRRPEYAPVPGDPNSAPGIIAFSYQESDDGHYALVEFVARDRQAFKAILADTAPSVKVFEKGKYKREDIEKAFKKLKKDFDIDNFGANIQ